jgi:hypothetical protein
VEEEERKTYLRTIVTKGNFLAPTSSQVLPLLNESNHSWIFIPTIPFRPVGVVKRFANVLRASKVFVACTFEFEWGNDQSQAVRRASGVHIVPNWGEIVARIRARSSTGISIVLDRRERTMSGSEE